MIEVQDLRKTYDKNVALNGISFSIKDGEFYGLLGPNGAGKTTTISIISTILKPDSGKIMINGMDLSSNNIASKKIIGVVPQEIALYDKLTAQQNLEFWGSLYNVEKSLLNKRIDETLDLLGLADRKNDKIKDYSGGMKRRINIASALLHEPKILFMDEPTVGIDPQSRNLIFEVVEKLHKKGMTIVYTTHYMEEAERFCDRIGIIDKGEIIVQGTLGELREFSKMKESIMVKLNQNGAETEEKIKKNFKGDYTLNGTELMVTSDNIRADLPKVVMQCGELGLDLHSIDIQKVNLETIFLKLTGKQLRD
ncbi:MAG TPA: ABC transporter ATP-binding protein [Bacteroidia bacterium]|jgi:ABC-2 type transport system ATP-binding protein|nr:ABC transporter ATP-binding protein [Bacteroidia bacterium]